MAIVVGPGISVGPGITIGSESGVVTANLVLNLDAATYSGSGAWLDTSGNGNDATLVQTPTYVSAGGSYFEMSGGTTTGPGTRDSFQVADSASLDTMTAITIEQWIYISTFQQAAAPNLLFDKRTTTSDGYVGFFTSNGFTFRVGTSSAGGQITTAATPSLTVWQQVAVTVGAGGSKIYINGAEQASSAYVGDFNNINKAVALQICDLSIAAMGTYALNGRIGVFRIYNAVLDGTEILANYTALASRYGL